MERARQRLPDLFGLLPEFVRHHTSEEGDYDQRLLLSRAMRVQPDWSTVEAAWELWARLRPARLEGDEDVLAIDARMAELSALDLLGPAETLHHLAQLAREVTEATARLVARVRARRHP